MRSATGPRTATRCSHHARGRFEDTFSVARVLCAGARSGGGLRTRYGLRFRIVHGGAGGALPGAAHPRGRRDAGAAAQGGEASGKVRLRQLGGAPGRGADADRPHAAGCFARPHPSAVSRPVAEGPPPRPPSAGERLHGGAAPGAEIRRDIPLFERRCELLPRGGNGGDAESALRSRARRGGGPRRRQD